MKHLSTFCVTLLLLFSTYPSISAQNCNIILTANPTTICQGGSTTITAQGFINSSNYNFDFNNSALPTGWSTGGANFFSSPCGPSPSNSPYYWAATSNGTPNITTNNLNVISGGTIQFEMRYAVQGGPTPCEGPDLAHEGVSLQYSINNGTTWVNITYFSPGGFQLPANPGTTGTVATGPTPYTVWNTFAIPIPPAAQTMNTRFRWIQFNSSGGCCDNWGLDNIQINAGAPVNYSWSTGQNGSNATSQVLSNLQSDTCVIVTVSDSLGNSCTDTVCITVIPTPDPDLQFPNPACEGNIQLDASGSTPMQINQYVFDIGNNGSFDIISANPVVSYNFTAPGVYQVMLYVSTPGNCTGNELFTVNVYPKPQMNVTSTPNLVCPGFPVTLSDNATINGGPPFNSTVSNIQWDFTNDDIWDITTAPGSVNNPYSAAGQYWAVARATSDAGCVSMDSVQVNVAAHPVADFSFPVTCEDAATAFTDLTVAPGYFLNGWQWNFDDGNTGSVQHPQHLYAAPGTYQVELIASAPGGCADTIVRQVTVHPAPVTDIILPTDCGLTGIFADNSTILSGSVNGWQWDFGDNGTSAAQNPTHTYASSGTYNVRLITISDFGCTDTLMVPYTNRDIPVASFNANAACLNDTTSFTDQSTVLNATIDTWDWSVGGTTYNTQNPSHVYGSHGVYSVQLVVAADNGCSDTAVFGVTVHPLPVADYAFTEVCRGLNTGFTNQTSIASGSVPVYTWDFGDGNTSSLSDPSHVYGVYGVYTVELIAQSVYGCLDTISKQVNVWPRPEVDFMPDILEGCEPLSVQFQGATTIPAGNTLASYAWSFGDGGTSSQVHPFYIYQADGLYDVSLTVTSDKGCDSTLMMNDLIRVFPLPIPNFTFDPQVLYTSKNLAQFGNQTVGGDTYVWYFGDGTTDVTTHPAHSFPTLDTATFWVTLVATSEHGCVDSITKPIKMLPSPTIYIPNSFSPNGDGINDRFTVEGLNFGELDFSMEIFDRWGKLLYVTKNPNVGWDGTANGKEILPQGTYAYRVKATNLFGQYQEFFGHVNLLP